MNIYIGNLSWGLKDQDLANMFAPFGEVTTAKIVMDKFTQRSKGFGFVEMPNDEQAQAELASDLSEAFDDTVHSNANKIEKLAAIDFGPKSKVEEGAVVKLDGRLFVVAVSTSKFVCDGKEMMGISTQSPIYAELEGKRAGDAISFNGRELVIEEVA